MKTRAQYALILALILAGLVATGVAAFSNDALFASFR